VAPFAVKVAELPEQMVAEFTVIVGEGFTVTVRVLVPVQLPLAPVTVYTVVAEGETICADPVKLPGIQV
jgi:hypothetical protein